MVAGALQQGGDGVSGHASNGDGNASSWINTGGAGWLGSWVLQRRRENGKGGCHARSLRNGDPCPAVLSLAPDL